jgi:hypothetical protein
MKRSDVVWSESTLNSFLEDPQAFIPGNRMPFDGLKEKSDRDDLVAYLKVATQVASLTPVPLPYREGHGQLRYQVNQLYLSSHALPRLITLLSAQTPSWTGAAHERRP